MPLNLFEWKYYAVYYIGSIQYDKPISITVDCSYVLVISVFIAVFYEAQPASFKPHAQTSFLGGKSFKS